MSKWITICDESYEGIYNVRTRGMAVPGGMLVQTLVSSAPAYQSSAISTVFVPDGKGISGNQGTWLVTQEEPEEPTGNTH